MALSAATADADAAETLPGPVVATVQDVLDGDTLAVRAQVWMDLSVETKVRIDGIDTPESRSRCDEEKARAQAAKRNLERLIGSGKRTVVLRDVSHDKYGGRVRATVSLPDGTDLAAAQIAGGHARAYAGGKRMSWCASAGAQVGERPPR